jgi:Molecular chaperone, HSP90 family
MNSIERVFVSYSSADALVARAVADACVAAGAVPFLDERALQPAADWYAALQANLAGADVVFVIVSAAALASRYVNQEIGMARQSGAAVVPLFLLPQDDLPPEIASLHGASIVGKQGSALASRIANLLAERERAAIDLPPPLRAKLDAHDARSATAFVGVMPAALGAPASGAPYLLPAIQEHGPRHVERLLRLTAWLFDETTLEKLSARDVATLVVAVIARERVLYVPLPALQQMLRRAMLPPGALADDVPVQRLWQDFVQHSRYEAGTSVDHRALLDLAFHDDAVADARALPLLGRFVLLYQSRLAHEAAALPPEGFALPRVLTDVLPGRLPALVPLLARSADEALRAVVDHFAPPGARPSRLVDGALPVVLAAALRCAGHLDRYAEASDAGLAPKRAGLAPDAESVPALSAIDEIRHDPLTDTQAVQVLASPASAFAYQAVLGWTRELQARLDECWAVIGEVYGTDRFGLRLRTASTPLADPARSRFDRTLPFVPQLARITTDSTELIRLLTAPLYGDRPEVGVRELLQNALDAVRERAHWPPATPSAPDPRLDVHACDVFIRLLAPGDGVETGWIEIVDGGVGMTPDTVRGYFLRVGASLRRNAEWMQRFPAARQHELLRSGRFGIGTLTAFLLGDEVHVATRHVSEADGIGTHFVARLADEPIELRRAPAPVGTAIRIPVDRVVHDRLAKNPEQWDWFGLTSPRVARIVGDVAVAPTVAESDPDLDQMPWRRLPFDGLERVLWRPGSEARQRLWVNGLLVESQHETIHSRRYATGGPWTLGVADVMVFDGRGALPLAVTRDRLDGRAPYHDVLLRDFLLDHCAWLLARAALPPVTEIPAAPMWEHYDGMSPGDGTLIAPPYVEVEGGLLPWATFNIAGSGLRKLVVFDGRPADPPVAPERDTAYAQVPIEIFGGFGPSRARR